MSFGGFPGGSAYIRQLPGPPASPLQLPMGLLGAALPGCQQGQQGEVLVPQKTQKAPKSPQKPQKAPKSPEKPQSEMPKSCYGPWKSPWFLVETHPNWKPQKPNGPKNHLRSLFFHPEVFWWRSCAKRVCPDPAKLQVHLARCWWISGLFWSQILWTNQRMPGHIARKYRSSEFWESIICGEVGASDVAMHQTYHFGSTLW